jgi:mono/diheme cytochrome c family protein
VRVLVCSTFLLAAAIGVRVIAAQAPAAGTTVKDKVYTKEQAARGQTFYEKNCAKCHALDDKPTTNDGPPLAGAAFLTKWDGKSVYELAFGIKLGMPPDGSIAMDDDNTADVVAYVIKANGFAEGTRPLKVDASAKTLMFVKK